MECILAHRHINVVLRWRNVASTCWSYHGPMSKLTLGQRSLSTLGQRKLSCYLERYTSRFTSVLPIPSVHGLFHRSMACFMCVWPVSNVQRCTTRSTVHAQFLNTSSTCHVALVVGAVSFPRNLHCFDVTSSHNFRRNFQ